MLKATMEILQKADASNVVEDVMSLTAFYDGTDCDTACLMEDIDHYLESIGIDCNE